MTAGWSRGWGSNIALFCTFVSFGHIWIFSGSEMKARLQGGGPEGWKCKAWLQFWSASLIRQCGWRPEPTARLGDLPVCYGSLGMLPSFCRGYGISALYSRLQVIIWSCEKILLFTWLSASIFLMKPVVTKAGMRGVSVPVSDPGSALQNQKWSFLLYAVINVHCCSFSRIVRRMGGIGLSTGDVTGNEFVHTPLTLPSFKMVL